MKYHFSKKELATGTAQQEGPYYEFLKHPALSSGIYVLKVGEPDLQKPHTEDEIYYVLQGQSRMVIGNQVLTVAQGDLIYVPAYQEHRFYDITEDLKLLVFFSSAPISNSL